jgi:hypothetical protein
MMTGRKRKAATCALVALGFVAFFPLRSWGDGIIPGPGDGYAITTTIDSTQEAPEGSEGHTHIKEQVAVGNTPATAGRRVVTHFTMMNQIKTCPNADGTAEGTGAFSMTVTSTDAQGTGTGNFVVQIRALAKYKGQVSDDAYLHDPVNADIDYTYTQSGSLRSGGAVATTPGSNVAQHITIQFMVAPFTPHGQGSTTFGAVSGGDPTQFNYSSALGVGMGLVQLAGFYYSVAETKWLQGQCVKVEFNPPSFTMLPVLGGQTAVNATLKTNGGESVKATYQNVRVYGGSVDPMGGGSSDVGSPLQFTYNAPATKVEKPVPGFAVDAVSHAGMALDQVWDTHLGTDWGGQITCSSVLSGDEGSNDLQKWSDSGATRTTIVLGNDGHGTVTTYSEQKGLAINKQKALRGGSIVLIDDTSSTEEGSASGVSPAMLQVDINKAQGTYSIQAGATTPMKPSKIHTVTCIKDRCRSEDSPYYVQGCQTTGIAGKLVDLNHLSGSQTDVKTGLGYGHNGTQTTTLTWNLARTGTTH